MGREREREREWEELIRLPGRGETYEKTPERQKKSDIILLALKTMAFFFAFLFSPFF